MKTTRPLSLALAVPLLAMLVLGGPPPAIAAPSWTVSQLTTDANRHIQPYVSGSRVIWLAADGAIYRVFTQKLGVDTSPVVVTTGDATDANWPKVSGDRIIWQENYAGEFNIYTRRMGTDASPVLVSVDSPSYNIWPEMSGDRVVWYGSDQIFTRKMGADASMTQLTDMGPVTDSVQVSGDRVVWIAHEGLHDQVFTQKVGTDPSPVQLTTGWDKAVPRVDGDRIVWLGYTNGFKQVFTQKMGVDASPIQLTDYPYSDAAAPDVSGDRIVWTNNERVLTRKMGVDAAPVQLSLGRAGIAKVSGDRVIWLESDGSDYQLIAQDVGSGDEPVQLSTGGCGQPQLSGEFVTWVSFVDGFDQVLVAHAPLPVLDSTAPHTTSDRVAYYANSATMHLTATDEPGGSGVAHTYYTLNGAAQVESNTVQVSGASSYTLRYWSVDGADNAEARHTVTFTVIAPPSSGGTPSKPAPLATMRHGRSFTVSGYVVKHTAGTSPITLQFYRYQSGHWVLKKSTTAKVSTILTFSRYSDSTSVPLSGKWRVRARHKVGSHYRYSGYRTFSAS